MGEPTDRQRELADAERAKVEGLREALEWIAEEREPRPAFWRRARAALASLEGAPCRVYWGSHGCGLQRGHEGEHLCPCALTADLLPHMDDADNGNVGRAPYYGPNTRFYGEDVASLEGEGR